jgi:hypothetical protein
MFEKLQTSIISTNNTHIGSVPEFMLYYLFLKFDFKESS